MVSTDLNIPQTELFGRLQKLMFLRVLFVSLLLGASAFIQVRQSKTYFGDIQTSHYVLIATIYFITFVYVILFKYQKNLTRLAYGQLVLDTVLITGIIYTTGGIESFFSFLYILTSRFISPRKWLIRDRHVQKIAQGFPAFGHTKLKQSTWRHKFKDIANMLLVDFDCIRLIPIFSSEYAVQNQAPFHGTPSALR